MPVSGSTIQQTNIVTENKSQKSNFIWLWLPALLLMALGIGLRLYDMSDPPLDFHATRQLRGAIIARSMYYQMLPGADPAQVQIAEQLANSTGQYEPSILEKIVAYIYLWTGGESAWAARVVNTIFWAVGGIFIVLLSRRINQGSNPFAVLPALVALAYYLVLPFGVQASRSFQPDPGMVMWIILGIYALYRWSETHSWKWALLAGLFGGVAILVKAVAAYIMAGAAISLVLYTVGWRRFWRSAQVWAMMLMMVLPSVFYYLLLRGGRASEYFSSWTLSLSHLLLDPATYVRWLSVVADLIGLGALLLGLLGIVLAYGRGRALLVGLWAGYLVYGLLTPYQMYTHSYYHIQLVAIVAISLVPAVHALARQVNSQPSKWRAAAIGIFVLGIGFASWEAVLPQYRDDYRHEPAYWQEIGNHLPSDGKILALTQDYGYRIMYYGWRKVILWPNRGEIALSELRGEGKVFEDYFNRRSQGMNYFLITAFKQLNDQPDLEEHLEQHYPVYAEGSGYLIYDLAHPLQP
ncbi:MAG TPA: glycosyltransferase family 39 protein [Anaerolineales bacterium]|nr:glycosyltransferase family 39 protein [Anaerolineales bacterium]